MHERRQKKALNFYNLLKLSPFPKLLKIHFFILNSNEGSKHSHCLLGGSYVNKEIVRERNRGERVLKGVYGIVVSQSNSLNVYVLEL